MSDKYILDKYALPNKWMADDFEKLSALMDKAKAITAEPEPADKPGKINQKLL